MFTQTGTTANLLFPFWLFPLHTHSRRLFRLKNTLPPLEIFIPTLLHLDRSKDGRVVQGGSFRYYSLRRRGFEPHSLHFAFIFTLHSPWKKKRKAIKGIEPLTFCLRDRCSATKLSRLMHNPLLLTTCSFFWFLGNKKNALAGNRTRVSSVAGIRHTIGPQVLLF